LPRNDHSHVPIRKRDKKNKRLIFAFGCADRLLCSTRGAITSYKPSWSTGPLDAAELRARAYDHLKVPPVSKANWTRVTVVNRPPRFPRHVENVEEVMNVVKDLGLEVNLVQEIPGQARSFREQVGSFVPGYIPGLVEAFAFLVRSMRNSAIMALQKWANFEKCSGNWLAN
jgi:hypothetical protein